MGLEKKFGRFLKGSLLAGMAASSIFLSSCKSGDNSPDVTGPKVTQPTKPATNHAPSISSAPVATCQETYLYSYQVQASDPDSGDRIASYSLVQSPSSFTVSNTGMISGTCAEVQTTTSFPMEVKVTDTHGASTTQSWNVQDKNLWNTYTLSADEANNMFDTLGVLYFPQPMNNFEPGDVVVAGLSNNTPFGKIWKITSVSQDKKTFQTTKGTLEDALGNASLSYSGNPFSTANGAPTTVSSLKGVSAASMGDSYTFTLNNVILYDMDGNPGTTYDQVVANGSIVLSPNISLDVDISHHSIKKLNLDDKITENSDLTLSSDIGAIIPSTEITVFDFYTSPVILSVLPPVFLTPEFKVYVGINSQKTGTLQTSVSQAATLEATLTYQDGNWTPGKNFSNTFNFSPPSFAGDWDLTAYAGARANLLLEGLVGPTISANATLGFTSNSSDWTLTGGAKLFGGIDTGPLSSLIKPYVVTFVDYEKVLAQNGQQPPTQEETFTDSRDGHVYKIVTIGNQTWMAENMDYNIQGSTFYNNDSSYESIYGRLYDFNSSKSACAPGWHLPSDNDWKTLFTSLGGENFPSTGGKMKATGTIEDGTGKWYSPNTGATNESGFTALPGGNLENGTFSQKGYDSYFWVDTSPYAYAYILENTSSYAGSSVATGSDYAGIMDYSVRCIKDNQ